MMRPSRSIFTSDEAKRIFDLEGIGRAPARLDFKKLENVCGHHMAMMSDAALLQELEGFLAASGRPALTDSQRTLLEDPLNIFDRRILHGAEAEPR